MPEVPAISAPLQRKKLAVFLDGTWNSVGDNTNVSRLKSLCAPTSTDGSAQLVYYEKGVNGFLGGTFGKGVNTIITEAYQWLVDHYDSGDDILIFGFSRGAYTARSLAGFIAKCGLLHAGGALGVTQLYNRYRRQGAATLWALLDTRMNGTLGTITLEEQLMLEYAMPVHIKMVGVWDTVGDLGIPWYSLEGLKWFSNEGFLTTGLRQPIDHGFHAMAVDEHRLAFSPTPWTVKHSSSPNRDSEAPPPRSISSVEQRWFVGAHANVGGGYASDLLPQIPLRWMMKKASLHGLAFRNDITLDGNELTAPVTDSYRQFVYGAYRHVSRPYYRPIGTAPAPAAGGTDRTESTVNETIDASVFARWNGDLNYRPSNLVDWAARHGVQIADLRQSVLAATPTAAAPD